MAFEVEGIAHFEITREVESDYTYMGKIISHSGDFDFFHPDYPLFRAKPKTTGIVDEITGRFKGKVKPRGRVSPEGQAC
jgi:hypothetical protein